MKKILLFLLFLFIFLYPQSITNAQTVPPVPPVFGKTPFTSWQIDPNSPYTLAINLPPFTNIIIDKAAFDKPVTALIYKGDFDQIKVLLLKDQYPVSSYSIQFLDASGNPVAPKKQIIISSKVLYENANAYYFFMDDRNNPYLRSKTKTPTTVYDYLPANRYSFIIATDHQLTRNDPSLTSPTGGLKSIPTGKVNNPPVNLRSYLFSIIALVIAIVVVVLLIIRRKNKKTGNVHQGQ